MEHGVLEQVTGIESVSTIKALQYAQQNNIPIHYITKENLESELSQITFSNQLISEIRASVNAGKIIIIPEHELEINQWSGVGYMVLDPDTFACGYMISGGMAGGAMTWYEVAWEIIKGTVEGIGVGLMIMFYAWLFPELIPLFIIAGIVGYVYMLYSISTRMYDGVINDDTREIQEAVIDGCSFILTSLFFLGLYEATKPDTSTGKTPLEEANEQAGEAKGGEQTPEMSPSKVQQPIEYIKNHLKCGSGEYTKSNGIKGAHNETEFLKQLDDFGGKITNVTELEPGINEYEYWLPRKDGSGVFYKDPYLKTTYDPSIISDETFFNRAMEAFDSATFDGRHFSGYDSNGQLWEGYINQSGEITTIYPIKLK